MAEDLINHPKHYINHPAKIECIEISEHFDFCVGNAIKYIFRRNEKDDPLTNLRKAVWYIDRALGKTEPEKLSDKIMAIAVHEPYLVGTALLSLGRAGALTGHDFRSELRMALWCLDREITRIKASLGSAVLEPQTKEEERKDAPL